MTAIKTKTTAPELTARQKLQADVLEGTSSLSTFYELSKVFGPAEDDLKRWFVKVLDGLSDDEHEYVCAQVRAASPRASIERYLYTDPSGFPSLFKDMHTIIRANRPLETEVWILNTHLVIKSVRTYFEWQYWTDRSEYKKTVELTLL